MTGGTILEYTQPTLEYTQPTLEYTQPTLERKQPFPERSRRERGWECHKKPASLDIQK